MKSGIVGLLAETSLHPGTESTMGVVDLPVARESATSFPFIAGSGLKGALRDMATQLWGEKDERIGRVFGFHNNAGSVAVTDARLLLLPVRSLTGHYKWITCPYIIERYVRDRKMAGMPLNITLPVVDKGKAITDGEGRIFLEELSFEIVNLNISGLINDVSVLIKHQSVKNRLSSQIVILNDYDFAFFAAHGLQVNARNNLENGTKTSQNLWYEETIPSDSLFYSLLIERPGSNNSLTDIRSLFHSQPYIQVGGNETIGQGWCAVSWFDGGGANGE